FLETKAQAANDAAITGARTSRRTKTTKTIQTKRLTKCRRRKITFEWLHVRAIEKVLNTDRELHSVALGFLGRASATQTTWSKSGNTPTGRRCFHGRATSGCSLSGRRSSRARSSCTRMTAAELPGLARS